MTGQENSNPEQRKYVRVNIDVDVTLVLVDAKCVGLVDGKDRIKLRHGTIKDLSAAGIRLKINDLPLNLDYHLLSGAIIFAIRFALPGQDTHISAATQAVWLKQAIDLSGRDYILGMKFTELAPEFKSIIEGFVTKHKK